jgi:hypothetical protein
MAYDEGAGPCDELSQIRQPRDDRLDVGDRMKSVARSTSQTMQRVKVGMSGLAAVVLLIGLASAIFSAASRERPVAVPGAAKLDIPAVVPTLNTTTTTPADAASEPLAELGVAPSTTNSAAPAATTQQPTQ